MRGSTVVLGALDATLRITKPGTTVIVETENPEPPTTAKQKNPPRSPLVVPVSTSRGHDRVTEPCSGAVTQFACRAGTWPRTGFCFTGADSRSTICGIASMGTTSLTTGSNAG